ncbi:MAG: hypothetical protein ABI972_12495 [Acidobacteriota bacterium]
MRYFLALFAASCLPVFAQGNATIFQTAPPEVDAALRERISKFYQAHMDGKFRQATEVVAEDSQDIFFAADKPRYKGFKIVNINYEENYTKAKVLVEVPWELITPVGVLELVARPMPSLWKIEDGKWFWYVIPYDPCKGIDAGMGVKLHKVDCVDGKPVETPDVTGQVKLPNSGTWADAGAIQSSVKASDDRVILSSHVPTALTVRLTNKFEGEVSLVLEAPELPGLTARLANNKIPPGEFTELEISYTPPAPQKNPDQIVKVRVNPTGQVIPVTVAFALPPVELSSGVKSVEAKPKK